MNDDSQTITYRTIIARRLAYLEKQIVELADKRTVYYQEQEAKALRHVLGGGSIDEGSTHRFSLTSTIKRVRRMLLDSKLYREDASIGRAITECENALMDAARESPEDAKPSELSPTCNCEDLALAPGMPAVWRCALHGDCAITKD